MATNSYPGSQVYQFARDPEGTHNIIGNYLSSPLTISAVPPPEENWDVHRMVVVIEGNGVSGPDKYGPMSSLNNGILFRVLEGDVEVLDILGGISVKTNGDWSRRCYDVSAYGTGIHYLLFRWTFAKSGKPLRIHGAKNQSLELVFNDDFSGLDGHTFFFEGEKWSI